MDAEDKGTARIKDKTVNELCPSGNGDPQTTVMKNKVVWLGGHEPQEQRIVTRGKMKNVLEMALGIEDLTLCLMTLKKKHDKKTWKPNFS